MKKINKTLNGVALFAFVVGLIILFVGVALMYVLPEYIIYALNQTGTFQNAQVLTALTQVSQLRSLGFVVVVIAIIWMIIAIVAGGGKRGM